MPTPSVPDGFGRASHEFTLDGATHTCVFTYNFADDPGEDPDDIATKCRNSWLTGFALNTIADTWNVGGVNVLINRDGLEVTGTNVTSSNGTAAFEPSPIGLAGVVRKRTGISGRAFRGRFWMPAGYFGDTIIEDDGTIDATVFANANTNLQSFLNT